MNTDDLLRFILAGGTVINNLTINNYTATNQVIGDNATLDARAVTLPAQRAERPRITSGGVAHQYSHCAPLDEDARIRAQDALEDERLNGWKKYRP